MPARILVLLACFTMVASAPSIAASETDSNEDRPVGQEFLPPEHWAYAALDRFEALGLVDLPSHRPFSRPDVVRYLQQLFDAAGDRQALSPRDRFELDRLEKEFLGDAESRPRERYDRPLLYATDDLFAVEGDIDAAVVPNLEAFDNRWEFYGITDPELRVHLRDWATYEVSYRIVMGPEHGDRARDEKPTPRTKSFKGLTSLYERAYVAGSYKTVTLFWGRDYADWGPSRDGNLLLSQTAGSLDKFGGRVRFRNAVLMSTHANLHGEDPERNLSAHRLELRFGSFVLGIGESVVYSGRGFDPLYLLPLSSFYANQFNERTNDDNIMWALDGKYAVRPGIVLTAGVLIDDFQFERDGKNPDKLALEVGGRFALRGPTPVTVRAQYRFVDIYTYSHLDSLSNYVTGTGQIADKESPLGAPEGPDADRYTVEVDVYPWPSVTATAVVAGGRRGEGNDFRTFVLNVDDPTPPFPSGTVETTWQVGGRVLWELPGNSRVSVSALGNRVENRGNTPHDAEWSPSARADVTWDF